jgi:hypothetical protein
VNDRRIMRSVVVRLHIHFNEPHEAFDDRLPPQIWLRARVRRAMSAGFARLMHTPVHTHDQGASSAIMEQADG